MHKFTSFGVDEFDIPKFLIESSVESFVVAAIALDNFECLKMKTLAKKVISFISYTNLNHIEDL